MLIADALQTRHAAAALREGEWDKLMVEVALCSDLEALRAFWRGIPARMELLPDVWLAPLRNVCEARAMELREAELDAEVGDIARNG